jgi:hypothetical protein
MSPDMSLDSLPKPVGNSWNWILQASGKTLDLMGHILASGSTGYSPLHQIYICISINMSKKQISMQLNSMTTEDTAIYYCNTQ